MYTVYVHGKVAAGTSTANVLRLQTRPMSKQEPACVCIRMSELIFHNPNNSVWNSVEQKKMATRLNNHDLHVRYVTPMRSFQVVLVNLLLGINPFPLQI